MPWSIESDHPECPASEPFAVVKDSDGEVEGCHPSESDAKDQLAALNTQEEKKSMPPTNDFRRDDLIRMVELPTAQVEFRAADDDDHLGVLAGYAAVFNTDTEINSRFEGHFLERIMPGAFRKTLEERGDKVKVLFNHGFDPSIGDKPLGKPRAMREDDRGLYVEVPLDDTSYNRDIVASLRSGALDGQSFRFSVTREEIDESGDLPIRTIRELKLYEFGPVTFPAYEATTAGVRAGEAYLAWRASRTFGEPDAAAQGTSGDQSDTPPTLAPVGAHKKRGEQALRRLRLAFPATIGDDNDA